MAHTMAKPSKTPPPRERADALDLSELAPLSIEELVDDPEQKGVVISDVDLADADPDVELEAIDIEASVLSRLQSNGRPLRARLDGVDLVGCDFANSELDESWWYDVLTVDCRLTGSSLKKVKLSRVTFDRSAMSLVSFEDSTLAHVRFHGCDLRGVDLTGATLTDVRFEDCELDEFVTMGTTLERVDLSSSDLGRNIDAAGLRGATIDPDQLLSIAHQLARKHGIEVRIPDDADGQPPSGA